MELKKHIIYIHRNKITGKIYIGQTDASIERRARKGKGYKKQKRMREVIEEFGWDSFESEVLEKDLSQVEADERETYWIAFFHSDNPEYGYNKLSGGKQWEKSRAAETKSVYCKETGQKFNSLSDAAEWAGLARTSMTNISMQIQGKRYFAGHHPETGEKLHWCYNKEDIAVKDKEKEAWNVYPVINLTNKKVYSSIFKASEDTHISSNTIIKCCESKGARPAAKAKNNITYWAYLEDYEKGQVSKEKQTSHRGVPKKVINIETGLIFNSMTEAAKWCGLADGGRIPQSCKNPKISVGKHPENGQPLHWRFVET